jgi:hypothetical protein
MSCMLFCECGGGDGWAKGRVGCVPLLSNTLLMYLVFFHLLCYYHRFSAPKPSTRSRLLELKVLVLSSLPSLGPLLLLPL